MTKESDLKNALKSEESEMKKICSYLIKLKPDIVITEKGLSSVTEHYLV